jgi:hypothetical protein
MPLFLDNAWQNWYVYYSTDSSAVQYRLVRDGFISSVSELFTSTRKLFLLASKNHLPVLRACDFRQARLTHKLVGTTGSTSKLSTSGSVQVRYFFAFWILHSLEHYKSFKDLPVDVSTSLVRVPDFL